jgi:two-component system NtrC family response regulator
VANILLIDDDADVSYLLREGLKAHFGVECLDGADRGLEMLARGTFDLVLLDNLMPRMTGIEFLKALQERGIRVPVILMTGLPAPGTTIQASTLRAARVVRKPPDHQALLDELLPLIRDTLKVYQGGKTGGLPVEDLPSGPILVGGESPLMQDVYWLIGQYTLSNDPVLILGETGTGKDLVAKALHTYSPRKSKPFVARPCADLTVDRLDELFGHGKGAAAGGTLFLDEVGDMLPALQDRLLHLLQEQEENRSGTEGGAEDDVRLVSATNADWEGKFRRELLYRIKQGGAIRLPPLRDRLEDLPELARHFLTEVAAEDGRPPPELAPSALDRLRGHDWPGNVRELRTVLRCAARRCRGPQILPADLDLAEPPAPGAGAEDPSAGLRRAVLAAWNANQPNLYAALHDALCRELLAHALTELRGDHGEAAWRLGLSPADFQAWTQRFQPKPPPGLVGKEDKIALRRARAITLIAAHPDWIVKRISQELGCAPATLWRDPIISKLLESRADSRKVPRGFKTRDGNLEAYDE